MFPTTSPQPRYPPLLLTGSLGIVTLLSIATMKILRLPLFISHAFAFRSAFDTSTCFLFLSNRGRKAHPRSRILLGRYDPNPAIYRRNSRLSQLPWRPISPLCPALGPRADFHTLPKRCFGVAPAIQNTKAPPFRFFRDSMTRLYGSPPTLNGTITGYRSKASFRWVVSPFRAGIIPPGL